MVKRIVAIVFLLQIFCHLSFGQSQIILQEARENYVVVKIKTADPKITNEFVNGKWYQKFVIDKGTSLLETGAPDIQKLVFSLITPSDKDARIEIVSEQIRKYENINLIPSLGKKYRDSSDLILNYSEGKWYQQNNFYPLIKSQSTEPYILRDFRGQNIVFYPMRYHALLKQVEFVNEAVLKIYFDKEAIKNLNTHAVSDKKIPFEFDQLYKYHFLNYKTANSGYTALPEFGKMLVLCPSKYATAVQDFIKWKEQKGYKVFFEMPDTMQAGNNELEILNRITQYYQNENILYVLLIGDQKDVSARNAYYTIPQLFGPSDIAYAYQSGNDHYPEFIVGRISADTIYDVKNQLQKILMYEKYPNFSGNWLYTQLAIGSQEGPGDKGQYDFEHLREIADSNRNFYTFINNLEMFNGNKGGNDANGDPLEQDVIQAFNNGLSLINYCGHGTYDYFVTSLFSGTYSTPFLTNQAGNWPVVISTACQHGNFANATCLAESLMRAQDVNQNPTGAVACLMSSINQSWDPPMQGQDEINAILRHNRNTYQSTFGALSTSGFMSTMDHYNIPQIDPHGGDEIADTWLMFGDPSLIINTADFGALSCTHSSSIALGSVYYAINCNEENTMIGLYSGGKFLSAAVVKNGIAEFYFPPIQSYDTIFITATKQNFKPYFSSISIDNGNPFSTKNFLPNGLEIYPNPANEKIIIRDKNNIVESVEIIDIQGRIIAKSKNKIIDCSSFTQGFYIIKLQTKEQVYFSKIEVLH